MCAFKLHLLPLILFLSYGHSYGNEFSEKIGNFSIELMYRTAKDQENGGNFVLSPMAVWSVMALIAEGAAGETLLQLNYALRLSNMTKTREGYQNISKWLQVHTDTVQLEKLNVLFLNKNGLLLRDFKELAKNYYDTNVIELNYSENSENLANGINKAISIFTKGRESQLVDTSAFFEAGICVTNALYFKGQWSVPYNLYLTTKKPFYDSNGMQIGEVNMMYNRYTYPFVNLKALQARIIEIPYGKEHRLSMLIMLPYTKVSVEDMFLNFQKVSLNRIFEELRESSDDEVDFSIPRFKIESNLVLTDVFKLFGIVDLFDSRSARLPHLARTPLYVNKIIHKAQIEVIEEGTTATDVTAEKLDGKFGVEHFECNRPFSYVVVEKVTNSIVFGGFYREPSLY